MCQRVRDDYYVGAVDVRRGELFLHDEGQETEGLACSSFVFQDTQLVGVVMVAFDVLQSFQDGELVRFELQGGTVRVELGLWRGGGQHERASCVGSDVVPDVPGCTMGLR